MLHRILGRNSPKTKGKKGEIETLEMMMRDGGIANAISSMAAIPFGN